MLTRTDKQIKPEVRKRKKSAMNSGQPAVSTSSHPGRANFAEAIAEMKRQWKATSQMNLPVLRAVKTPS